MDLRTLQVARVGEILQARVSAGAKVIDFAQAARLAGIPETELPAVVAEVELLLASVLNPRKNPNGSH